MTDPDTRAAFGKRLRALRKERGFTSGDALAEALKPHGINVSGAAVRYWETGKELPRPVQRIHVLDEVLDTGGELAAIVGLAPARSSFGIGERLTALEDRVGGIEALLVELQALVEAQRSTP